jgi:hypothetical protein
MQARYGHKWSSSYPDAIASVAMAEWASGLAGLTGEQIRQGLEVWDSAWPPSLPEFRNACKPPPDNLPFGAAHRRFPKALPKPKAKPEIAQAALDDMRRELHT